MDSEQIKQMAKDNGDTELVVLLENLENPRPAAQSKNITEQLGDVRRHKGLTQAQLGAKIGMSQSAVARIENGKVDPTLQTLKKMAKGLDCDIVLRPA